jgi:hypothetical protein
MYHIGKSLQIVTQPFHHRQVAFLLVPLFPNMTPQTNDQVTVAGTKILGILLVGLFQPAKLLPDIDNLFTSYANFIQFNNLMTRMLILARDMNRQFTEEHIQMASKCKEQCLTLGLSGKHKSQKQ